MSRLKHRRKRLSSFQMILLGFAGVIVLGALILMLPISSAQGIVTSFDKTLFTSVSAVCVTGLVVVDTGSYWSIFGQAIIIMLIQIGGLGVITFAASLAMLSGRKISLMQRSTMQNAISAPEVGGIVRLTRFILLGTFIIETAGALLMMPAFCKDFGLKGIWYSFFHSISAFCNAGFDILGTENNKFSSLTDYAANPFVNIAVMLLITIGGIGFLTWDDICTKRFHIKRYRMQSKVVLVTSALLVFIPAIFFFFADFSDTKISERIFYSLFQSVTTRTAGFNTVNLSEMSGSSRAIMTLLMLVGGSPGSTAGGMKTTTIAVLFATAVATFFQRDNIGFFGRRIENSVIKNVATIVTMYTSLFFVSGVAISVAEKLPLSVCLYETASAIGTVGLTLGITPSLSLFSRVILMGLMYFGRVGGLTLIYAAFSNKQHVNSKLPQEKITVG